MSKYVWDFNKIKKEGVLKSNTTSDRWFEITIGENKELILPPFTVSKINVDNPSYLYTKAGSKGNVKNIFIPLSITSYSSIKFTFNSFIQMGIDNFEQLVNYIKKPIPTITINGQNVGGMKLKGSTGAIKEVPNILYKDSAGNIRNLK